MGMNRCLRGWFLALVFLPLWVRAALVLQRPARDEVISAVAPDLRAFLDLPQAERRAFFTNKVARAKLHDVRDAQPYAFQWGCTKGEKGDFVVVISEREDFSLPSPALVLPSKKSAEAPHEALIANFLIGRTYYWKVECKTSDGRTVVSPIGRFKTDPRAPRLLLLPDVGNVRDLGGRLGLNGKRIRQGLVFRSAGLNANSPDFDWDRKKWKKATIAEFSIGAPKLTSESVSYVNRVMNWRTDLDLRSDGEVGPMNASPAGPAVKWVHNASAAYGEIYGTNKTCVGVGPDAMARNFRVFCDRANYPIDIHCIAGADRTGSLSYVLNGLLGVDKDELEKDWEITANSYFSYGKMFDSLVKGFDAFGAHDDPPSKKIEAYLLKIGIKPEEIDAFRTIMLEE